MSVEVHRHAGGNVDHAELAPVAVCAERDVAGEHQPSPRDARRIRKRGRSRHADRRGGAGQSPFHFRAVEVVASPVVRIGRKTVPCRAGPFGELDVAHALRDERHALRAGDRAPIHRRDVVEREGGRRGYRVPRDDKKPVRKIGPFREVERHRAAVRERHAVAVFREDVERNACAIGKVERGAVGERDVGEVVGAFLKRRKPVKDRQRLAALVRGTAHHAVRHGERRIEPESAACPTGLLKRQVSSDVRVGLVRRANPGRADFKFPLALERRMGEEERVSAPGKAVVAQGVSVQAYLDLAPRLTDEAEVLVAHHRVGGERERAMHRPGIRTRAARARKDAAVERIGVIAPAVAVHVECAVLADEDVRVRRNLVVERGCRVLHAQRSADDLRPACVLLLPEFREVESRALLDKAQRTQERHAVVREEFVRRHLHAQTAA